MKALARMMDALTWVAALFGPALLTAILLRVSGAEQRYYVFLYLGLVAVLGVLRGPWPGFAAAAVSFLLVDYFFVPPVGGLTIAGEQDLVNLLAFAATAGLVGLLGSQRRQALLRRGLGRSSSLPPEYALLSRLARQAGTVVDHRHPRSPPPIPLAALGHHQ